MVVFSDLQESSNPLNGVTIKNNTELEEVLKEMRNRAPFFFELESENGYKLLVGLGELGCVQFGRHNGEGVYQMAVAPGVEAIDGYVEFLAGGTSTPVSTRYCMPLEQARQIMFYFLEHGHCHPKFSWEVI